MENKKDIAIVGMSCFAPEASNYTEYWNNLINGVDCIKDVPVDRLDPRYFDETKTPTVDRFYCKRGGFIPDILFDPMQFSILPLAVEGMDTAHLLALKNVYEALEDASVFEKNISLKKCALVIGKGAYVGSAIWRAMDIVHVSHQITEAVKKALPDLSDEELDKIKEQYQASRGRYQADSMPGLIPNLIASLISNKLDMQGPSYVVDAACASSLIALDHCVKELESGRCDIAVAGGVHVGHNAPFWSIFSQLGALSHKQHICPFSENADGLLIGEGSGFVVLKMLDKAIADKDRIYAVIKGVGVSSDGSGVAVMAPSVKGQKLAIETAWANRDLDKSKIGYLEAHGTATTIGDKTELQTLSEVFPKEECDKDVLIGSVKSNIGHAMPAAGILGLIKTVLALYTRKIPPTLHCEHPLKGIENTRFRPVQKLQDWDENKYPLVGGVNAFGFGGINAHVILEAYGDKRSLDDDVEKSPFHDKVIAISSTSKEELIKTLRDGQTASFNQDGDYRLVLFNPTPDRIEKAIKFIEKDLIWKGRQDIWFTNKPLIKNGGKIAFMYPGYDPGVNPEIESLINYFKFSLPEEEYKSTESKIIDNVLRLYRINKAMDMSLKALNIKSDMNVGHSLGEWFGVEASGMVSGKSIKKLINCLDASQYKIDGVFFIAVSVGRERVKKYLDSIPNLYLSNDNCPNQVLLCATEDALKKLSESLRQEDIFFQVLPYQSGFHTPFIKDRLDLLEDSFQHLEFLDPSVPMWSSNTLEPYPTESHEIKALSVKHLIESVRFRELIEKLYDEENVRVFIQVGGGSLVGFVDDILVNKPYSSISEVSTQRTTLEQLRRVMALLYIEGRNVDMSFLNVEKLNKKKQKKGMNLQMLMGFQSDFPLLSGHVRNRLQKTTSVDFDSLAMETSHPIMSALNENIKEMAQMQMELAGLLKERNINYKNISANTQSQVTNTISPVIEKDLKPTIIRNGAKTGSTFEEDLYVSLDTHPTLIGHSLVKQPANWNYVEDLNPVIPMTMTFELIAEAAHRQDLSKKIVRIGPISVYQWMEVHTPFVQKINGVWKSDELLSLNIKNYASGEVTLRNSFSKPDSYYEDYIDLGEDIRPLPTPEQIYEKYMFHGIEYQGIEMVTNVTEKGIRSYIRKKAGKGSLLDNMGQTYGLYLHLILDINYITFPVKVQEITFYQDMHDQEGLFECICLSKTIDKDFTTAEMILKREGKVWCIVKGWQNRRFEFDSLLWEMTLNPGKNFISQQIAPGVFLSESIYNKTGVLEFLRKRYLNQPEKKRQASLPLNKRKDYLTSRIALKDSLRWYVQNKSGKLTYPIEYFIKYDDYGKPYVYGIEETKGLEISLAHKNGASVSIVSEKSVGIDIETIEERTKDFLEISFTPYELELIKDKDITEWSTRFWVAKEAYGKMLGVGLQGNPKRYEVKRINDDILFIEDCEIRIFKYKNYIIGWTQ